MKSSSTCALVAAALLPLAFASPVVLEREAAEVVYVTDVATAVETAQVTVTADYAGETAAASSSSRERGRGGHGGFHWQSSVTSQTQTSTSVPTTSSTSTTQSSAPVVVAPPPATSTSAPPPPPPPPPPPSSSSSSAPSPTSQASAPSSTFDPSFINAAVDTTNTWRSQFQAPKAVWNETSAGVSMQTAKDNCGGMVHKLAGQNFYSEGPIYISTGETKAITDQVNVAKNGVNVWGGEYKDCSFSNVDSCLGESTGHFTQLVWQASTTVGCAAYTCPKGDMQFVCTYFPWGNVGGQAKDNVKSKTS